MLFNTRLSAQTAPVMLTRLTITKSRTHTHIHTQSLSAAPGLSIFASRKTKAQKEAGGGHHFIKLKRVAAPLKTRHKQFKLSKQTGVIGPRLLTLQAKKIRADTKIFTPHLLRGETDGWIWVCRGWLERTDK